jgi:molecular chaperone HtpG
MTDPIDEYVIQQLKEFDGKKLRNCTKEGLDLEKTEEEKSKQEKQKQEFEPLCKHFKEVLGDQIEKCTLGFRLVDSPCVLVTTEWGWSANMERIMKAQALKDSNTANYMMSKKTMEINPNNATICQLLKKVNENASDRNLKDLIWLMYETALISSGFNHEDPSSFSNRIHRMIKFALNVEEDETVPADMPKLEENNSQITDERMEGID